MSQHFTNIRTDRREHFGSLMAITLRLLKAGDHPSDLMRKLTHLARAYLGPRECAFLAATFLSACEDDAREKKLVQAAWGVTPILVKVRDRPCRGVRQRHAGGDPLVLPP